MSMAQEFKQFALRGNVVDMAVGIIVGAAFGKIVSSFVSDVVMPPLGLLLGGVDFKYLAIVLQEAVGQTPAVMNSLKAKEEEAPAGPPTLSKQEILLTEIRDLLKDK